MSRPQGRREAHLRQSRQSPIFAVSARHSGVSQAREGARRGMSDIRAQLFVLMPASPFIAMKPTSAAAQRRRPGGAGAWGLHGGGSGRRQWALGLGF